MFSFRRKPRKEPDIPRIRTSPSLPELNSQGIPWPEDLVDVAAIQQVPVADQPQQGAAKSSFEGVPYPIPFHKPFRPPPEKPKDGPISSLYMSSPPSAFDNRKTTTPTAGRFSNRRARVPPTFNLMRRVEQVVGAKGIGKTALLRLLLDTADISPTATIDQKAALDRFLRGSTKSTQSIETACVELCESRFDRVLLSVIDTPGLDYKKGKELKLERQVNSVLKYVDAQYADTLSEESKVIRKNRGDQHIHVCLYMIDPKLMVTVERHTSSTKTRSENTVPPDLVPDISSGDDSEDEDDTVLTMSPAEIRVIHRLSTRANILPVIAHADSLTDEKLQAVKLAGVCLSWPIYLSRLTFKYLVRKGLADAGIDLGAVDSKKPAPATGQKRQTHFTEPNGESNGHDAQNGDSPAKQVEEEEVNDERQSRPVIKLRSSRHPNGRALSRSRSRRDLSLAAEDDRRPVSPDATDKESVAVVRFSAQIVAKTNIADQLPFAFIAPEGSKRRQRPVSSDSHALASPTSPEDDVPPTPSSAHNAKIPYLHAPPEDLKGVFTRNFRWGTVDVLDPSHCDFAALRTVVLSTHSKVLTTEFCAFAVLISFLASKNLHE
ncbi:hypothetical protein C0991_003295 [Blastosporella zonata]|nr:hypothetical protein C0991_003295 [Blastosporella zonata]